MLKVRKETVFTIQAGKGLQILSCIKITGKFVWSVDPWGSALEILIQ